MCQIVCQIVACASMRIVVSQVCGLLSVAYSASFWLRATMRRHTYSAVQPVPSMCCFSTYLLSAFVEYASCLQLYTMCLIEEYARKSYNKPNYKAHSFAVRRMRRRCRRCGLMCVCVSPANARSSKYITMVAKAAPTAGRRWPFCQSMGGDALSRRNKTSITSSTFAMSTPMDSSALKDAGLGPAPGQAALG